VAHMTHVQVAHKSHSAQACWDPAAAAAAAARKTHFPAAAAAARKTHLAAVHRMDVVQQLPREL
jgi:hypothetical protein